jgi:hypothetical protein
VTVLLTPDAVALYARGELQDEHGWHLPAADEPPKWEGRGNLQLNMGDSQPRMDAGGGRGPFGPAFDSVGQLYLPDDAVPEEGQIALIRSRYFVLSNVRYITDPLGGDIGCWLTQAQTFDSWPGFDTDE